MKKLMIALVVIGVAYGVLALKTDMPLLPQRTKTVAELTTTGSEESEAGALLINGWLVKDIGPARMRAFWERYQPWLGEPIGPFDGRSQMFRMGKLTYTASNPDGWQVELDNLGWQDLALRGLMATPGSEPHSAVRAWLIAQLDVGTDVPRLVGRVISPAICDHKGRCSQWADKARLDFAKEATSAEAVSRAPLGLYLSYPRTRSVDVPDGPIATTGQLLGGAAVVLMIGLLLLGRGGRTGRRPPTV